MTDRFEVDQPIMCVSDKADGGIDEYGNKWPTNGRIYTIRCVVKDEFTGNVGFLLNEIVNEPKPSMPIGKPLERGWCVDWFRLLRKTSIDQFRFLTEPA